MEYKWKIVKYPTYEVTRYPHLIRFTGEWDCPVHKDRVIIEMDYDDAVTVYNNTDCKEFQTIVKCINAHDVTPSDWEVLVGKDIDFLDTWTPRHNKNKGE
jgi:hypothetical protein